MKVKDILKLCNDHTTVLLQDKKGEVLYGHRRIDFIMEDYTNDYATQWFLNKEVIGLGVNYNNEMRITIQTTEIENLKREDLNAWLLIDDDKYQCTRCDFKLKGKAYWYCPHCGVKMEGGILR